MDFGVSYEWTHDRLGRFYTGVNATWIDKQELDGDDLVGSYLTAEWNGTVQLSWGKGDWMVNVFGIYRGERERSLLWADNINGVEGEYEDSLYLNYTVQEQLNWNTSVSYRGPWDTTVTVGVNNVFNNEPPADPFDPIGTTPGVNDPEPAFWYVRLETEF
jgi:outer membrane receptor protein involved in Fe transport